MSRLFLVLVLILSVFIRLRLASMPLERDEGEYAVIAQGILAGVSPFQEAYSVKFPGTALAYAGIMKIFGQTDWGIRMGLLLVNLLTVLLIYIIGYQLNLRSSNVERRTSNIERPPRQLAPDFKPSASRLAEAYGVARVSLQPSAYIVASLGATVLGLTANAEHFVILFAMMGFGLLLNAQRSTLNAQGGGNGRPHALFPVPCSLFFAGLCFGLSICMKQQGLFFALFGFIWILSRIFSMNVRCWALSLNRSPIEPRTSNLDRSFVEPRASSVELPVFLVGIALPLFAMLIWLKATGTYPSFRFWCFDYARHYGEIWSWRDGLHHFRLKFFPVLWEEWPFFILAAWGLLRSWQNNRRAFWFVSGLILTGFLATSPGLIFRPHYFLFILPGLSLASGLGAFECGLIFERRTSNVERPSLFCLLSSAFCLLPLLTQFPLFFLDSPEDASRRLFAPNAFPEMRDLGLKMFDVRRSMFDDSSKKSDLSGVQSTGNPRPPFEPRASSVEHSPVERRTSNVERTAILGSEPEIYFYSKTPPGSPYLYMYPLLEPQPDAEEMQRDFMNRLEKDPPRYVIFLPWRDFPTSWLIYPHSPRKLLAWIPSFLEKNYVVEKEFQAGKSGKQRTLFLFRRK